MIALTLISAVMTVVACLVDKACQSRYTRQTKTRKTLLRGLAAISALCFAVSYFELVLCSLVTIKGANE